MKRTVRDRRENALSPVEKIEISEKHSGGRFALFIIFLVVGIGSLVFFAVSYFIPRPGWEIVRARPEAERFSGDLVFSYYFTKSDSKKYRNALSECYSDAVTAAAKLFDAESPYPDVNNVCYINENLGEWIPINPALREAFGKITESGNRYLYFAPVYEYYKSVFLADSDVAADRFDPNRNERVKIRCEEAVSFASDPDAVKLTLSEDCKVCLDVSDEYKKFAEAEECRYMDFFWLKNAFIMDCVADKLIEKNYTKGVISSLDGFARNLDDGEETYATNVFSKQNHDVYVAGRINYSGRLAMATFKNYPINSVDGACYHAYENGDVRTPFVRTDGPNAGGNASSLDSLCVYSRTKNCVDIALAVYPVYVADEFDASRLASLAKDGIFSVYCEGTDIKYNDKSVEITPQVYDDRAYSAEYIGGQ